jgi:hypothetical protein
MLSLLKVCENVSNDIALVIHKCDNQCTWRRMCAKIQTLVPTPATKVAVDRSLMQPTTNFTHVIKQTNVYV